MKPVMVWNQDLYSGPLFYGAHIGTACIHNLPGVELDMIYWAEDSEPTASMLAPYDTFFVNVFIGSRQVEQIRALRSNAVIVAIAEAAMDEVFLNRDRGQELRYLDQLAAADFIGVVSKSNREFYSAFCKPIVNIPVPVGTDDFFAHVRNQEKQDFILVADHGPRNVDSTIPNMAALRLILNRHPELKIAYFNPSPFAVDYARAFGLDVMFLTKMSPQVLATAAGKARIGIDLYTRHGAGRHGMLMAYAGTPVVGSSWTGGVPFVKEDPWHVNRVAQEAHSLLTDAALYASIQRQQLEWVQKHNSFAACAEQWQDTLEMVERYSAGKVPA